MQQSRGNSFAAPRMTTASPSSRSSYNTTRQLPSPKPANGAATGQATQNTRYFRGILHYYCTIVGIFEMFIIIYVAALAESAKPTKSEALPTGPATQSEVSKGTQCSHCIALYKVQL